MTKTFSPAEIQFVTHMPAAQTFTLAGWTKATDKESLAKNSQSNVVYTDGENRIHTFRGSDGAQMWRFANGNSLVVPIDESRTRTVSSGTVVHLYQNHLNVGYVMAMKGLLQELGYGRADCDNDRTTPGVRATGPSNPGMTRREIRQNSTDAANSSKMGPDEVRAAYRDGSDQVTPASKLPRYMLERGLLCNEPDFLRHLRVGKEKGELRFPYSHYVNQELVAACYEGKNSGGYKNVPEHMNAGGFWMGGKASSQVIICVESPIDAISYHMMSAEAPARYLAIRKGGERHAAAFIKKEIEDGRCHQVILSFDNDYAGQVYTHNMYEYLGHSYHDQVLREVPPLRANDWNDALKIMLNDKVGGPEFRRVLDDRMAHVMKVYLAAKKAKEEAENPQLRPAA